jgi:hypothetical protein
MKNKIKKLLTDALILMVIYGCALILMIDF